MIKDKKEEAKKLRRQGHSYREISKLLNIAKSTASIWTRQEKISPLGQKRMYNMLIFSQIKARGIALNKKNKRLDRLEYDCPVLKKQVKYKENDLKIFLALLYWAEGAKRERRLVFMNSDPDMVRIYLGLLRKSFKIKEEKISAVLHLHDYHDPTAMISFWSKISGIDKKKISVYNKKHSGLRRREDYKGCLSVRYSDFRILDEIMLIIKRFSVLKI
jgi:hypothetical protein